MFKTALLTAAVLAASFSSVAIARADMDHHDMDRRSDRHMMHDRMEHRMMHRHMEHRMMRHHMMRHDM